MAMLLAVIAACGQLYGAQSADETPPNVRPSALEMVAGQAATILTWSLEAGRIQSSESTAVVTAVEYESSFTPGVKLRGVRLELSKAGAADVVFIEENRLRPAAAALREIVDNVGRFGSAKSSVPRYSGSEEFRQVTNPVHAMNPSYYTGPDGDGLAISVFKRVQFKFPSHSPSELAAALLAAAQALEAR